MTTTEITLPGEQGAADAFVSRWRGRFGYCAAWQKYVTWDGKRWSTETGEVLVRELWQQHLRALVREALDKGEEAKRALKRVAEQSGAKFESSMLTLCRARTAIDYHGFDADPWALNVANGILDLRTGALRPHDPAALCTHLAPVAWDPAVTCPQWLAYLEWAMQGDLERVAYLQRFFGLCLTGDAEHELAHFFYGGGGNGKTTVVKTIEAVLGDYARRAPARILMQRKHDSHPTELAGMCGRRLVVFAETNENQTLDEQQLKVVSSKDPISARRMREDFWDYVPTHKALLLTNNKPRVRGQDDGIWRRIVLVEWGASVADADKDPHFGDRFAPELPGILLWAWQGLQAVLRDGLQPPSAVAAAGAAYRLSEDSVPRWLESECECGPDARAAAGELYVAYSAWAQRCGESFLTQTAFGRRLDALGYSSARTSTARERVGLRLRGPRLPWVGP